MPCHVIATEPITLHTFCPKFDSWGRQEIFHFKVSWLAPATTQPPVQWVPRLKWPGHTADLNLVSRVRLNGVIPLLLLWHLINHRERGPLQCSLFNAYCMVLNNVSITKIPTAFTKAIKHIKAVAVLIVPITYLAQKWIINLLHHHVEYFCISICTVKPVD